MPNSPSFVNGSSADSPDVKCPVMLISENLQDHVCWFDAILVWPLLLPDTMLMESWKIKTCSPPFRVARLNANCPKGTKSFTTSVLAVHDLLQCTSLTAWPVPMDERHESNRAAATCP